MRRGEAMSYRDDILRVIAIDTLKRGLPLPESLDEVLAKSTAEEKAEAEISLIQGEYQVQEIDERTKR